ncbi:uncharacterized protein LOC116300237 [Actinia tenebrosa]|uniref:Uncharacterized protein LOC116300237 n=1 Tax=Actinia tenebrosa TaxID=6105 RepID=A0A6P8IBY7_ACTTE|nr:uncharacterized protein LOC116300237 [Actinia tenebrosa]
MKPLFQRVFVFLFMVCLFTPTESRGDWTPEFLSQTMRKRCILGKIERDVTFLHGTDSGDFQKLGKVADMEVCVLLCCEMDNCEAAFMADRNCYAVKCHSQEHCVTAPAQKNKWHPSVVFVKKISQSNKDKATQTAHALSKQNGPAKEHAPKEMSAEHKDFKFQVGQSKVGKESQTAQAQNNLSGTSKEQTKKKTSAVQKNINFYVDQSKVKESHTAQAQDKQSKTSKVHVQKEKPAAQNNIKNSQIPESSDDVESNGIMNSMNIPVNGKPSVVRLDEEETKTKTIPLDKRKMEKRDEMFKKSKNSLITAAVLTCSMAVVLSGIAVIAARIRKKQESHQDSQYSEVPTAEK